MAREYAIPSSSTILQDFGLTVANRPSARNRRVVIIGTASDGPLYEPVVVDLPEDAEYVWGFLAEGDLVRGIFECWHSQPNNQNIVGVRIGNAKTSILELHETNSNGINEEDSDDMITSLRLKGRFPGPAYDLITIKYDNGRNHAGDIAMFNPKTRLYSYFKVDTTNYDNTSVDAHNVAQLAYAINTDRNMSSVVTAEYDDLTADYELAISGLTPGVSNPNVNTTTIKLLEVVSTSGSIVQGNDAYIVTQPELPYDIDAVDGGKVKNTTVTNNIIRLKTVEGLGTSQWDIHEFDGFSTTLDILPLDGKGTSRWDTIQALKDYDNDFRTATSPTGNIVSEFMYNVDFVLADEIPTSLNGYDELNQFNLTIDLPLDDTDTNGVASNTGVVYDFFVNNNAIYSDYAGPSGLYTDAKAKGVDKKDVDGVMVRPFGAIRVFVSDTIKPEGQWTELPYDMTSGVYLADFIEADPIKGTRSRCAFGVGTAASGCYDLTTPNLGDIEFSTGQPDVKSVKWTNMTDFIGEDGKIKAGKFVRITGVSVKGFISEVETLSQLQSIKSQTATNYFVRGQELLLNASANFPMIFNYGTRIKYEIGTSVILKDPYNGILEFTGKDNLPGPGGGIIQDNVVSHIRLHYDYMPNFPHITSSAASLFGGTAGNNLTVKERESELRSAYEYLRNYEGDIWVPMKAHIDAIKEDYNQTTGLLEDQGNSYAQDIADFLDEQSINLYQPHAVLGTTEIEGSTLGDKDDWVTNLTEYDIDDPVRGANMMSAIQNKFITVTAFEPVFMNTGRGNPYSANGQAAYAGLIASMPYDLSPTNKSIPGIYATRFPLSMGQLEALNGSRYVTMKASNTNQPVIVNDITAAPYGSDYVNWSIFSITKEAADRIKRLANGYIGRPNSIEIRNALDQDISNILKNMAGIQAFNFSIASTIEQQILGVIEIDLVIVPVFTIKKIRTTIKLRKNVALG